MKKFAMIKYSEVLKNKVDDYNTSFVIKPLERGFAHTLGNSLRRALLSSIPSVASFAIKIFGIEHEFQTIPGVEEDVVRLILNVKKIRFFYDPNLIQENEIIKIELNSSNGEIRAKDLIAPEGIKIVNKDLYIATANKKDALKFELFIISGRGFVSFEDNKNFVKTVSNKINSTLTSGALIAIDSNFSPIVNVSFEVRELNTASAIIEEELKINIITDKSITAIDAFVNASKILLAHFQILSNLDYLEPEEMFAKEVNSVDNQDNENTPINQLELSVRSYNSLKRAGYNTLEELKTITIKELGEIKNLGQKSKEEIIKKLAEYNITLEDGD
ncbi:MAG: DNA-directed RNA polymerase subunit alpha [Mycoplasma sp.]|nr:DNA-directed RNA polymerase subunit alpha [Mycoplasma sp.]